MMFSRRNKQPETLTRSSRYASTPLHAPGDLYTSRRHHHRQQDAADRDLLLHQEMRRYEELFEPTSNSAFPSGPGGGDADDDTLMDGSIYTSSPTQASAAMFPPIPRTSSPSLLGEQQPQPCQQQPQEDASLWGLESLARPPTIPAETSLLTSEEAVAAQACASARKNKNRSSSTNQKKAFVPPVPVLPADHQSRTEPKATEKPLATPVPASVKKSKFKSSFSMRLFGASQSTNTSSINATNKNSTNVVPSTPASQPTPNTQASTPAPASNNNKIKFLSPAKLFRPKQRHPNLLLASLNSSSHIKKTPVVLPAASNKANQNSKPRVLPNIAPRTPPARRIQRSTPPPSPPPPMDHCECNDGMSVGSSLTDALVDPVWMHPQQHNKSNSADIVPSTPPCKTIGGGRVVSPLLMEDIDDDGGLSFGDHVQLNNNDEEEEDDEKAAAQDKKDDASTASPGALLLTKEGLYFHNHHGKPVSPLMDKSHTGATNNNADGSPKDDLAALVWADKEQRLLEKETKALAIDDINPEDADMQVVKILGLQDGVSSSPEEDDDADVKRNLFGTNETGDDQDISLAPLQQVVAEKVEEKLEQEENDREVNNKENRPLPSNKKVAAETKTNKHRQKSQNKSSSKFKRFLSKLVTKSSSTTNKSKQQQEAWLEQERAKATEGESERLRMEEEETKRIEEKKQRELERQRKLEELGSHQSNSATSNTGHSSGGDGLDECLTKPRSFSLLSGSMQMEDDETESPAAIDLTSLPAAAESKQSDTAALSDIACVFCQRPDHPRTHIVIPCMHYVLCDECVEQSRGISSIICHCPTCDSSGFLYARVGVLEGPELQAKLLQLNGASPTRAAPVLLNQ